MFLCLLIILVTLINASSVPENGWHPEDIKLARPILNAFNNERLNIDLYEINYDFLFGSELLQFKPVKWFSEKTNVSAPFPTVGNPNGSISINAYFVMDYPEMKWWKKYGYGFAFHYNSKQKLKKLIEIGRNCYEPFKCSRDTFNNFVSCIMPEKKCSRANLIYPYVYMKSFSRISCLKSNEIIICFGRFIKPSGTSGDGDDFPFNDPY